MPPERAEHPREQRLPSDGIFLARMRFFPLFEQDLPFPSFPIPAEEVPVPPIPTHPQLSVLSWAKNREAEEIPRVVLLAALPEEALPWKLLPGSIRVLVGTRDGEDGHEALQVSFPGSGAAGKGFPSFPDPRQQSGIVLPCPSWELGSASKGCQGEKLRELGTFQIHAPAPGSNLIPFGRLEKAFLPQNAFPEGSFGRGAAPQGRMRILGWETRGYPAFHPNPGLWLGLCRECGDAELLPRPFWDIFVSFRKEKGGGLIIPGFSCSGPESSRLYFPVTLISLKTGFELVPVRA